MYLNSTGLEVPNLIESSNPSGTGAFGGVHIANEYTGSARTGGLKIGGITTEQKYAEFYWADATDFYVGVDVAEEIFSPETAAAELKEIADETGCELALEGEAFVIRRKKAGRLLEGRTWDEMPLTAVAR